MSQEEPTDVGELRVSEVASSWPPARPVREQDVSAHAESRHVPHDKGFSEGSPRDREAPTSPIDPTTLMALFNVFQINYATMAATMAAFVKIQAATNAPPPQTTAPAQSAPPPPPPPPPPPTQQEEPMEKVKHSQFLKLKPTEFSGEEVGEDRTWFLEGIEKACRVLGCSSIRSVESATYRLKGKADKWWTIWTKERDRDSPPVEWEEFKKLFMDHFIPQNTRLVKAKEFETLKQGSMTIEEYDTQFHQLSSFTTHMHLDERLRIRRFVMEIRHSLLQLLKLQMESCPSYTTIVDIAKLVEMDENEDNSGQKKKRKREFGGSLQTMVDHPDQPSLGVGVKQSSPPLSEQYILQPT